MQDSATMLPSETSRTLSKLWGVIRDLGKSGRPFTPRDLKSRLPATAPRNVIAHQYITQLAAAGYIERADDRISLASAEYRMLKDQSEPPMLAPVPEPIAFFPTRLSIQIPRSDDGIWMLMRWLDQHRGPFTRSEVERLIGDNIVRDEVANFVRALVRGGFLIRVGRSGNDDLFRVDRKQVETPRLRSDGMPLAVSQRASHLWRGVKMLGFFTARDLAIASSLPDWPVSEAQAGSYVDELASAGYLLSRVERGRMVYRLKPKMNTGPAAPQVLRARFVWDPNLCRVMGDATRIEEVRS